MGLKATEELNNKTEELQQIKDELEKEKEEQEALTDILSIFDDNDFFNFRRRRRSIRSSSNNITISYCPAEHGNITDTAVNLIARGIVDIGTSVTEGDITNAICLVQVLKYLKSLNITLTEEDKQQLKSKKDE